MAYAERLSRTYASLLRECGPGAQSGFGVAQTDRSASRTIAPEVSEHAPPLLPAPGALQLHRSETNREKLPENSKITHRLCNFSPQFESAQSSKIAHRLSNFLPNSRALTAVELHIDCLISSPNRGRHKQRKYTSAV